MKSVTNQIIDSNQIKSNWIETIFAIIFSILSIGFSLSIIIELSKHVNGLVLIGISILIITVLIYTEINKVQELIKLFKKEKYSLFMLILTHTISIFLSGIGIYFFTDKTTDQSNKLTLSNAQSTIVLTNQYQSKIDSINNLSIQSIIEYVDLNKSLSYWKSRKASDISERNNIRSQIQLIESNLITLSNNFNQNKLDKIDNIIQSKQNDLSLLNVNTNIVNKDIDKNVFLTSVLIGLTLLIKIFIIYIAKARAIKIKANSAIFESETANRYKLFYSAIKYFYAMKGKNTIFYINEFSKDIPFFNWQMGFRHHLLNQLFNKP